MFAVRICLAERTRPLSLVFVTASTGDMPTIACENSEVFPFGSVAVAVITCSGRRCTADGGVEGDIAGSIGRHGCLAEEGLALAEARGICLTVLRRTGREGRARRTVERVPRPWCWSTEKVAEARTGKFWNRLGPVWPCDVHRHPVVAEVDSECRIRCKYRCPGCSLMLDTDGMSPILTPGSAVERRWCCRRPRRFRRPCYLRFAVQRRRPPYVSISKAHSFRSCRFRSSFPRSHFPEWVRVFKSPSKSIPWLRDCPKRCCSAARGPSDRLRRTRHCDQPDSFPSQTFPSRRFR